MNTVIGIIVIVGAAVLLLAIFKPSIFSMFKKKTPPGP
jgi:hypothetical protein